MPIKVIVIGGGIAGLCRAGATESYQLTVVGQFAQAIVASKIPTTSSRSRPMRLTRQSRNQTGISGPL